MKNKVFQQLVDFCGDGVSCTYEQFGQLKLKNGVELTLNERLTGFDISMVLNDGHNEYHAYTSSHAIDNIYGLFVEMGTAMETIIKQKREDAEKLRNAHDKWMGEKNDI